MARKATRDRPGSALFSDAQMGRIVERLELVGNLSRLRILVSLAQRETSVLSICEATSLSQPGTSNHLYRLRVGGLVRAERRGKQMIYSLTDSGCVALEACGRFL